MPINQAEALGFPTVVAFDAGNLSPVAEALYARLPDKPVVILGDNDRYQEITQGMNPGKSKAQAAALTRIKPYTDFNNLATQSRLGREGVEYQIRAIYRRKNSKIGHAATSRSVESLAPPGVRRRAHQKAGDYPGLFAS